MIHYILSEDRAEGRAHGTTKYLFIICVVVNKTVVFQNKPNIFRKNSFRLFFSLIFGHSKYGSIESHFSPTICAASWPEMLPKRLVTSSDTTSWLRGITIPLTELTIRECPKKSSTRVLLFFKKTLENWNTRDEGACFYKCMAHSLPKGQILALRHWNENIKFKNVLLRKNALTMNYEKI